MKRRIGSLCVALALCLGLLPANVLAADGDSICVGGVTLTGSSAAPAYATTDDTTGAVTTDGASADHYNVKWDGSTLTLKDANIQGGTPIYATTNDTAVVYARVNCSIDLKGNNTITVQDSTYGICCGDLYATAKSLSISGDGTLTVAGSGEAGIHAGSVLTISGGTVNVSGSFTDGGIYSHSGLTISGGTIMVDNSKGPGINTNLSSFAISDGTITASGSSTGISIGNTATISGGTITASGGTYGINFNWDATISGGTITASGGTYGIYGDATISGGTITASGGT